MTPKSCDKFYNRTQNLSSGDVTIKAYFETNIRAVCICI